MRFITKIVRRLDLIGFAEPPKARVRGKSPRARLRAEALSFLA
ncbi:hypothetical protein [Enhygromyxa salina]|uniref:Uncharacterized protein n=1 Tax=Enhygromyxa salina TaxID=215803 RepID=A0A2S9XPW1_9BACT|nr:hypothetical protein [Enhygromyxa salina]PRP94902.1 hypothetical protein ENSA7_77250 [Enhygromyxa salina]